MDRGIATVKEQHPRETANVLSLLSFFYTIKLFAKGYRKSLETDDLYEVLNSCRSKELGDQLETQWSKRKQRDITPTIIPALWVCFGKRYLTLGLMQLIIKVTITIWSPVAFSKLISYFSPNQSELTKNDAIYYACVVILLNTINLFFYHNYMLALTELGTRVRTAIASLLYRKSLKLSPQALSNVTVGKITTIITRDVDTFEMWIYYGNDIWIGLVQTVIICYLIYNKIGVSSFAGILFFLIVLPAQGLIGTMAYKFRLRSSIKTDKRLELTQEILSAIKIIKMYTWERFFEKKIGEARKNELSELHKLFYTKVMIVIIGSLCSKVAFFIFLMAYVWMGNNVTAEIVYYVLTCFNDLEYALSTLIPFGLSFAAEVYATSQRIQSILEAKERIFPNNKQDKMNENVEIRLTKVTTEIAGREIIRNASLTIYKGLNVVVGHVGSGKTTFLLTLLQDLEFTGTVITNKTISYASQEPWLFPSTIKNNILFGEKYKRERYEKVLKICSLDYDLKLFGDGDETIVGDRGINLSKGQQARVNLARAIYKDSDIYLLDDCLAALDANVSDTIFKECVRSFLKNKLCIFVTNNFDYVKEADRIIVINDGNIEYSDKTNNVKTEEIIKNAINNNNIFEHLEEKNKKNELSEEKCQRSDVYFESKKGGKVSWSVYYKYVGFGGGVFIFGIVLGLFIAAQTAASFSEKLMSNWVTIEQNISTLKEQNQTQTLEYQRTYEERTTRLNTYTIVVITCVLLSIIKSIAFFNFTRIASIKMHQAMVRNVINASMRFFDSNFIGNILNRFSKDLFTIDEYLPFVIIDCLTMAFVASGGLILITSVNTIFLIECLILFLIACVLKHFYQPTGRNLHRLNALTRSPMIGHLNSTLEGLTTIRASNAQEIVKEEFDRHQNLYTSANFLLNNCTTALAFSLELFGDIFTTLVILQFLISDLDTTVGDVGLAITQGFIITDIVTSGIKNLSDCENQMTSVERILEYTEVPTEDQTGEKTSNFSKPSKIQFENVSLSYNERNQDQMLNNISFTIEPQQKFGIVGRTGAGKTSIISSLFRMYEIQGKILVGDVDIKSLPLRFLRQNIAVIPQDPFLFSGTIRENLDPFKQYHDEQIWRVLEEVKLKNLISDLNTKLDKGSSFSAGQKQLFCLARVILRNTKIVVLDEATANVDQETDFLIQETVRRNFHDCTVIIIAHRLLAVLNCQKVVVMSQGRVSELDEPGKLLQDKTSFLHSVIK